MPYPKDSISDAFKSQLPDDRFYIQVDDGEDVLVKKKRGEENFELNLVSNTFKSVHINLDREGGA